MFSIAEEGRALLLSLTEIQKYCQDPEMIHRINAEVSEWSVGQHCEHILKADRLNLRAVDLLHSGGGEEGDSSRSPHPVLLSGFIPTGMAEAPRYVQPADDPQVDQLTSMTDKVLAGWAKTLEEMKALSPPFSRGILHHEMGLLDIPGWVRFARVHTDHHLKIIDLIRR